jgi:hypothetical protein
MGALNNYPASYDEAFRLFAAIAMGGVHLTHLDLSEGGWGVNDGTLKHFWIYPGADRDPISRHPRESRRVPCPELEYFSVLGCNVSALAVAEVLLCHPKLTYVGFREMGAVFKVVEEQVLREGREFKCLLTHVSNW